VLKLKNIECCADPPFFSYENNIVILMENELVIKTIFKTREKKKEVLWAMEGNRTATSCSLNKLI
jgi:hypothetical protein